jgi:hypothetical protein
MRVPTIYAVSRIARVEIQRRAAERCEDPLVSLAGKGSASGLA